MSDKFMEIILIGSTVVMTIQLLQNNSVAGLFGFFMFFGMGTLVEAYTLTIWRIVHEI